MGIEEGDRVFVPTMTFTASAEVVRYLNAEPLLLDVDYRTSLLTPEIRHPEHGNALYVYALPER